MRIRRILQAFIATGMGACIFTPLAAETPVAFSSPSERIFCYTSDEAALICLMFDQNWSEAQLYALQPDDHGECNLDQTPAFELPAEGPPRLYKYCHGDVFWPAEHKFVLPYGYSLQNGEFSCQSETNGMTCHNRSGHGFSMARAAYEIHSP